MFRSIFGGKRASRSHRDTLLQSEPQIVRSYVRETESKAQMWNLRPNDTRNTRFEKKWRATFFQLTLCVVVRLLNSINFAACTLRLIFWINVRCTLVTLVFLSSRRLLKFWILSVKRCVASTANTILHWNCCNTGPSRSSVILQGPFFLDSSQTQIQSARIQQTCLATSPLHFIDQVAASF